ncbi:MAG: JAB domain-containing protein, partial [Nitrospira sp.]
ADGVSFRLEQSSTRLHVARTHNHPSGDQTPSSEDRQLTTRLKQAADIIGIRMLDHVIIGESGYYSFADNGCLL